MQTNIKIKPKAIIFDWDNTLAQTRDAVVEAIEKVLKTYNKEPWEITKTKYRDNTKSFKENFENFFGDEANNAYNDYLSIYNPSSIKTTKCALEFLEICLQNNINLYIISNKEKSLLIKEVDVCFPNIKFSGILGNGEAKHNKPAADPVFLAMTNANFEINKDNIWLVGDSKQDTECAFNANIQAVLIGQGLFIDKDYLQHNPDVCVVNDFAMLINLSTLIFK